MLFVITDAQNELAPCSIVDTISSNFSIQMMTTCIAEHEKSNLIANLQRKHPGNVIWMHIGSTRPISQLDMSTARRSLKSPQSLYGTFTHSYGYGHE